MRAAIYIRVSTNDQTRGSSLQSQLGACRRYAQQQGWDVIDVWQDVMSGTRPDRPQYQAMLADRSRYDVILVWRLDRLGRNEAEYFVTVAELQRQGIQVASATEPNGSAVVSGIMAVLAADESRRIGERVRPGQHARRLLGKWLGAAPFGYVYDSDGRLAIDPGPAHHIIETVYRLYDPEGEALSLCDAVRRLNALGLGPQKTRYWHHAILRTVLHNPAYCGDYVAGAVTIRDNHPALVPRDQWERVQARMAARRNNLVTTAERPNLVGAGLVRCECGERMDCRTTSAGRHARSYVYWRCHSGVFGADGHYWSISAPKLESALRDALAAVPLPSAADVEARALAILSDRASQDGGGNLAEIAERIAHLRRVESNLIDMRANAEITREQFADRIERVRSDLAGLTMELARLRSRHGDGDLPSRLVTLRNSLVELRTDTMPPRVLAAIVALTVEQIVVSRDKSVRVVWRDDVQLLRSLQT